MSPQTNYKLFTFINCFCQKMYQTRVSIFKVLKLYLFYFTTNHLPSKTWATPLVLSMVFFCSWSRDKFVYWGAGLANLQSLTVNSISIEANTYSSFSFSSSRSKKTSGSNETREKKSGVRLPFYKYRQMARQLLLRVL